MNALAGHSRCPQCGQDPSEFAFAFPPGPLLVAFIAKARADGLHGVVVVPFAPSDPACQALAAASLTHVDGQLDRCDGGCLIVPNSCNSQARAWTSAARNTLP